LVCQSCFSQTNGKENVPLHKEKGRSQALPVENLMGYHDDMLEAFEED